MAMSNKADTVRRFWDNYRNSLKKSGVRDTAVAWYVRHAEAYVKVSEGRRLALHSAADVEAWLTGLGG